MKKFLVVSALVMSANVSASYIFDFNDLLGRDLIAPPPFTLLGHVALGYGVPEQGDRPGQGTPNVIEVLNTEKPIIHKNKIIEFRKQSKFWGGKYGIVNHDRPFARLGDSKKQMLLGCNEYTYTTIYRPTGFNNNKPTSCGQFRCDTFVLWNWQMEPNAFNLFTPGRTILPKTVWDYVPKLRNSFTDMDYNAQDESNNISPPLRIYSIDNVDAQTYATLDLPELDMMMSELTFSKANLEDKTNKLWSLYSSPELLPPTKRYTLDTLANTADETYILKFIESYESAQSEDDKIGLLVGMQTINQRGIVDPDVKSKINSFYENKINQAQNREIPYIVRGILDESAENIDSSKTNLLMDKIDTIQHSFDKQYAYWLLSLKSDAQASVVAKYESQIKTDEEREIFNDRYEYTKDKLSKDTKLMINDFKVLKTGLTQREGA